MCLDRFEICNEIMALMHESIEPHTDWKYIAERHVEIGRVFIPREENQLNMLAGVLKR
jgi:hypothetical protein